MEGVPLSFPCPGPGVGSRWPLLYVARKDIEGLLASVYLGRGEGLLGSVYVGRGEGLLSPYLCLRG